MIEVMFVDDEQNVLAGLRRSLYHLRGQWRMRFASSGAQALQQLRETPADVVVSDMRMPEMDGRVFLCQVRRSYPGAIRVALSGQTDLEATVATVGVSHRFLDKPCDPEILVATVQRLLVVRERIASQQVREFIGSIDSLPTAPSIIEELNTALLAPSVTAEALVAILERDPAVTAKLLQLANSGVMGTTQTIRDVRSAVDCLGLATVRDLATATAAFSAFSPASPWLQPLTDDLERHSLEVAQLAAGFAGDQDARPAFAVGVLHDIGILMIATKAPEKWTKINDLMAAGIDRPDAEREVLGVTHAELGSYLLALWGLPASLYEAVAWHHDASDCTPWSMAPVHAVHLAETLVDHRAAVLDRLDPAYVSALGMGESLLGLAHERRQG